MKRLSVLQVLAAAVAIVLLLVVWFSARRSRPGVSHSSSRLPARLPTDYGNSTLSVSADGTAYTFVLRTADGCQVVEPAQLSPLYSECGAPRFVARSKHVFYWAVPSLPAYERLFNWIRHAGSPPAIPPVLVINGQVINTPLTHAVPIAFDEQGTHWALAGRMADRNVGGKKEAGMAVVLADGHEIGRYNDASRPAFTADAKHLAFLGEEADGRVKLIVDGNAQHTYERVAVSAPEINQGDSSTGLSQQLRVAYLVDDTLLAIAPGGDGWTAYRNDQRVASYFHNVGTPQQGVAINLGGIPDASTAIVARSLVSAEKAPVTAWWERLAGSEERWRVVRDGTPDSAVCARFWKNETPVLSADGKHLAYPCYLHPESEDNQVMVVVDGKQFGPYENAWALTFSADGAHFAYAASDGSEQNDWSYYVDGKVHPLKFEQVWQPHFNESGTHIAWQAQRGKRPALFLDGHSVRSFDEVVWGPVFSPSNSVSWVIHRGRRVERVEIPLSQ